MDMFSTKLNSCFSSWVLLVLCGGAALNVSGQETGNARGPIIDMPYEIVSGWLDPFQEKGFAFGGNSAIWGGNARPHYYKPTRRDDIALPYT